MLDEYNETSKDKTHNMLVADKQRMRHVLQEIHSNLQACLLASQYELLLLLLLPTTSTAPV
jgi:hypothetical protein